jgi:hypothetical protein
LSVLLFVVLGVLHEWTAVLESKYQNQPQICCTAFMIILTYIWRVTNNHSMALLRNPGTPPPAPSYGRIQEHLVQGTLLHLTALPDQVAIKTFVMPPMPPASVGRGDSSVSGSVITDVSALTGAASRSGRSTGSAPPANANPGTGCSQPDPPDGAHCLNKVLQDAWDATRSKIPFSRVAPGNHFFKEDPATRNRVVVLADNGVDSTFCLAYALNGQCYQNCGKRQTTHCALTHQEIERVAAAATPPIPL